MAWINKNKSLDYIVCGGGGPNEFKWTSKQADTDDDRVNLFIYLFIIYIFLKKKSYLY